MGTMQHIYIPCVAKTTAEFEGKSGIVYIEAATALWFLQ